MWTSEQDDILHMRRHKPKNYAEWRRLANDAKHTIAECKIRWQVLHEYTKNEDDKVVYMFDALGGTQPFSADKTLYSLYERYICITQNRAADDIRKMFDDCLEPTTVSLLESKRPLAFSFTFGGSRGHASTFFSFNSANHGAS